MVKVINKENWKEVAHAIPICAFGVSVKFVEDRLSINFFDYLEEGLGQCYGLFLDANGCFAFLSGYGKKSLEDPGVLVSCRSFETQPNKIIDELVHLLGCEPYWVKEDLTEPKWILFRQGIDGKEVEINRFLDPGSAEFVREKMQSSGGKHVYYIRCLEQSRE